MSSLFINILSELNNELKQRKTFAVQHHFKKLINLPAKSIFYDLSSFNISQSKDETLSEFLNKIKKLPAQINKEILFIDDCLKNIEEIEKSQNITKTRFNQFFSASEPNILHFNATANKASHHKRLSRPPNRSSSISDTEILEKQNLTLIKSALINAKECLVSRKSSLETERIKTLESNMPLHEDSICIRIWHLERAKPHQVFGQSTDSHISVEVHKDGKREYMSFYPDNESPKKEPTFWSRMAKRLGFPSLDKTKSKVISSIIEDLERMHLDETHKLKYKACETIVINAKDSNLDLDAIIEWMNAEKANPQEFQSYTQNCARIGFEALKAGGAEKISPFPSINNIVTLPGELIRYSENLVSNSTPKLKSARKDNQYYKEVFDHYSKVIASLENFSGKKDSNYLVELKDYLVKSRDEMENIEPHYLISTLQGIYEECRLKKAKIADSKHLPESIKNEIHYRIEQLLLLLPESKPNSFHSVLKETVNTCFYYIESFSKPVEKQSDPEWKTKTNEVAAILKSLRNIDENTYIDKFSLYQAKLAIELASSQIKELYAYEKNSPTKNHRELLELYISTKATLEKSLQKINEHLYFASTYIDEHRVTSTKQELGKLLLAQPGEIYPHVSDILGNSIDSLSSWDSRLKEPITAIQTLLRNDINGNEKIKQIDEIINKNRPSILAFWKRGMRKEFELIRAEAKIIIGISQFLQGSLNGVSLAQFLSKNRNYLPSSKKLALETFIKLLIKDEKEHQQAYEEAVKNKSLNYRSLVNKLNVGVTLTNTKVAKGQEKTKRVLVEKLAINSTTPNQTAIVSNEKHSRPTSR